MTQSQEVVVIDRDGKRGLVRAYQSEEKRYVVDYDGQTLLLPSHLMVALGEHYYTVPLGFAEILREDETEVEGPIVIPILEESLRLGKRIVERGKVRIHKTVNEHEVIVDEPLIEDRIEVEHVPINRLVKKPIGARVEGNTTIIPVLKEVLVVRKQLMLVEEVRLTRRQVEVRRPQSVTLRKEEVRVERVANEPTPDDAGVLDTDTVAVYAKGE